MKMFRNGLLINIPAGTWAKMTDKHKAEFTNADGSPGTVEDVVTNVKTQNAPVIVQKKTIEEVAPVVVEKDDITGNPPIEEIPKIPAKQTIRKGKKRK